MPRVPSRLVSIPPEPARWRRVEVLSALLAICRSLERMQTSVEARTACREVRAQLSELRERERSGQRPSRP